MVALRNEILVGGSILVRPVGKMVTGTPRRKKHAVTKKALFMSEDVLLARTIRLGNETVRLRDVDASLFIEWYCAWLHSAKYLLICEKMEKIRGDRIGSLCTQEKLVATLHADAKSARKKIDEAWIWYLVNPLYSLSVLEPYRHEILLPDEVTA